MDIYRYGYWRYINHINDGKLPGHKSRIGKPDQKFEDRITSYGCRLFYCSIYIACSIGWFLKERLKEAKQQEKSIFADHLYLQIPDGKEEIKVQVGEIAYLCRKGKDTFLRTHDGRAFIFWESLDKVEKQLDPAHFCRASRTYIIARKAVRNWHRQTDRGVFLEIQPQNGEPVKVSRDRAADVIAWIKKHVLAQKALL